jgi:YHS domain-containing protein
MVCAGETTGSIPCEDGSSRAAQATSPGKARSATHVASAAGGASRRGLATERRIDMRGVSASLVALVALLAAPALPLFAGEAAQTVCPVSGKKIDRSIFVDVQGQRVYFCCPKCPPQFTAKPDAYFAKMAAAGVVPENVQTTCPVSGEKLDSKDFYRDYKGRRIYFCCNKCPKKFDQDPELYLKKMAATTQAKPRAASDHEHHPASGTR